MVYWGGGLGCGARRFCFFTRVLRVFFFFLWFWGGFVCFSFFVFDFFVWVGRWCLGVGGVCFFLFSRIWEGGLVFFFFVISVF